MDFLDSTPVKLGLAVAAAGARDWDRLIELGRYLPTTLRWAPCAAPARTELTACLPRTPPHARSRHRDVLPAGRQEDCALEIRGRLVTGLQQAEEAQAGGEAAQLRQCGGRVGARPGAGARQG